eukprot:TRINITY_DN13_c0_g1_i1.p2 TRINITY_DN13_c0_g1~~TRINITY_DN13_c0_g1_i1.p2  ORF type:complete len:422 (+),score=36.21 TRINITY_DN13_c0_g1_i1:18-1283(+)
MANPGEAKAAYDAQKFSHVIVVPSYAQWFNEFEVSAVERAQLAEFFDNSKQHTNEQTYKRYRNFIISLFRRRPTNYLGVLEVLRKLPGDTSVLTKIHQFLEKWGLINYGLIRTNLQLGLGEDQTKPSKMEEDEWPSVHDIGCIPSGPPWHPDETTKLMQGMKNTPRQWQKIAEYVGTRNKLECQQQAIELGATQAYHIPDFTSVKAESTTSTTPTIPKDLASSSSSTTHPTLTHAQLANGDTRSPAFGPSSGSPFSTTSTTSVITSYQGVGDPSLRYNLQNFLSSVMPQEVASKALLAAKQTADPTPSILDDTPVADALKDDTVVSIENMDLGTACAAVVGIAAARTKLLAELEEDGMSRLLQKAISLQLQKLNTKLEQFAELEGLLSKEQLDLERQQEEVFQEKLELMNQQMWCNVQNQM